MKRALVIAIAAALPLVAAGCSERPMVTIYKQGQYQGKPDKQPWDNEQFKGDRSTWEKAVNTRALGQNEYARITGG